MEKLYRWWKRVPVAVRKPLILIIGSAIVVTGIAMLVLPGPGWAAIFLGFAVLATEFAAAEKVRSWLVEQLKHIIRKCKNLWEKYRKKPKA
jgi:uncharacterized protein (TIGR02611 family)